MQRRRATPKMLIERNEEHPRPIHTPVGKPRSDAAGAEPAHGTRRPAQVTAGRGKPATQKKIAERSR